ncbi:type ISP restriction/modification enzyme [Sphingopyxis microcysteis]|uniref:type ISP restriction/modification enzyme n=1 Tax=Sphingopyxis microcysteis TaxID=2484145 RepID=UPI001F1653C3|nr:type ISP restriction/modification enzyme [Sphingopyxis microcysteis]
MTQADRIKKAVGDFGAAAKAKLANPAASGQPEDQLRAPLETLFTALAAEAAPAAKMHMVGESSLADLKTRPDYAVTVNNALIGFVEVKAPGKGADPRKFKDKHDKAQWDRLKALPNLIYTDGNGFSLWRDGELQGGVVRLTGDIESDGGAVEAPASLLTLVHDFLTWEPIAPRNARQLAAIAARLSRFLRDEVIEQMERGSQPLIELRDDWRGLLFPEANDEQFADGYAQAVTFGLLMAKSRGLKLSEGFADVARELGETNTLIGVALRLLTDQQGPVLVTSLDTMLRVLDVVDWSKVSKGDPEAWLYFYEHFLEVYDNSLRKKTGSYYTPPEVVQTMVRLCDEALKSSARFAVPQGLAGPEVHVADPAMGSGTFLLGVMRQIAATIENDQGAGAVGPAMTAIAQRLIGFELQFGAFAVAQLRMLAEMIEYGAAGSPRLFVTDTLGDPHAEFESGTGIYRELSRSRREANEIKRSQPITVVIGNPPYKEKAKGKGSWVESGSGNRAAPLNDWQPPAAWGVGAHAKHLRNLYIYFWRWAAWKVFEQGAGGRDLQPPVEEHLSGIVCYITTAGFLNGPGFQMMRSDLRSKCDEIWVVDCSPEGHQPEVATRIFQDVQQPVCIVLASRSPANCSDVPASVKYRALGKGSRDEKFAELSRITLDSVGWDSGAKGWRAPFLPEFSGGWADMVPLDSIIGDCGSGVMPGRTWIIAPDAASLYNRWDKLVREPNAEKRRDLFHPHLRNGLAGDRHIDKPASGLAPHQEPTEAIGAMIARGEIPHLVTPILIGYRSFDRQFMIPDARLINQPNPSIWKNHSSSQVYLTALMSHSPTGGPGLSFTSLIPDLSHYRGSFGGRVFALWKDAAATDANIAPDILAELARAHGAPVDPVDVFAYVAALLAHPAYVETFRDDLVRPGLRVPLTADAALFAEAAKLGREVIWLHSFGERFADGHPAGPPRMPEGRRPTIPKDGAIPATPEGFPDSIDYDPELQQLKIGTGFIDHVPPAVWAYEVSGKQVLRQWFSYRKKDRERPQIGDRRKPSPLGDIQPDHWLSEYTSELINVLNVLGLLVELEPAQADLLKRVCDGPLIPASRLANDEAG